MDPEISAAMLRVQRALDAREPNQVGLKIPALVNAIIDEEADEELIDLVRSAMSSKETPVTMPEVIEGVLGLVRWRQSAA